MLGGRADFRSALAFCQNFRVAGIGALFLGSAPKVFRQMLHHSGRAYAHFLGYAGEKNQLTGRALPFFDAVAAGDFEGAELVARRSRHSWAQGEEYEEDFLFVEFLMQHAFLGAPPATSEALLHRYETSLQGAEDLRLPVCRALLDADSDAFNESLGLFLADRNDRMAVLERGGTLLEEVSATEGNLSVEGLALVRLAHRHGLQTERDYLHVPSTALKGGHITFTPDAWQTLWD
jgi:hypothetical protein